MLKFSRIPFVSIFLNSWSKENKVLRNPFYWICLKDKVSVLLWAFMPRPKWVFDNQFFLYSLCALCLDSIPKTNLKPHNTKKMVTNVSQKTKTLLMITQMLWDNMRRTAGMGQDGTQFWACFVTGLENCFCERFHNDGATLDSKGDQALMTFIGDCNNVGKYLPSLSVEEWIIASLLNSRITTSLALANTI